MLYGTTMNIERYYEKFPRNVENHRDTINSIAWFFRQLFRVSEILAKSRNCWKKPKTKKYVRCLSISLIFPNQSRASCESNPMLDNNGHNISISESTEQNTGTFGLNYSKFYSLFNGSEFVMENVSKPRTIDCFINNNNNKRISWLTVHIM